MESLRRYVEEAVKAGATPDDIKTKLAAHDWDEQAIADALKTVPSPPLPASPDPTQPQQSNPRYLQPGDTIHVKYASLKLRIAAQMLDVLITLPAASIILFLTFAEGTDGTTVSIPVWIVTLWFYFAIFESSSAQATFGKKLLGIYVARSSGENASFRQTSIRFFAKTLSALPLGVGVMWANYNPKHQMFHDLFADTVVVIREPVENPANIAKYTRLGLWAFFVLIILPIVGVLTYTIFNLIRPSTVPPSSNNPVVTGPAASQARDATRKTDITSYASALAAYNATHHAYPVSAGDTSSPTSGIFSSTGPLSTFASGFPVDPKNGQPLCQPTTTSPHVVCSYHYLSTGPSYVLWAELELPGSGGGVYYTDSTGSSGLITSDPTTAP